jgi:uncharacterized coiled-coil DUF342 family protein
LCHPIYN